MDGSAAMWRGCLGEITFCTEVLVGRRLGCRGSTGSAAQAASTCAALTTTCAALTTTDFVSTFPDTAQHLLNGRNSCDIAHFHPEFFSATQSKQSSLCASRTSQDSY